MKYIFMAMFSSRFQIKCLFLTHALALNSSAAAVVRFYSQSDVWLDGCPVNEGILEARRQFILELESILMILRSMS